ncbi:hypothetical protein POSPLADRAFT_1041348 [Postia placenta MAD-698-R-SB12]|uniref:Uncharacterized protein n=1 Tax=Postia placenta MAD-698-R-SB12 TaxID=670580 RepID=A0A1X6MPS6_9APHY|nr:hypothetical protein POSPLADRAFT_1041348 [Postia placenta MAD-698-R-SB12]OSX58133.1 hypothetical protein POSPLADRAFT_1041348 [Postia placenta MAD-698-R-SB12]
MRLRCQYAQASVRLTEYRAQIVRLVTLRSFTRPGIHWKQVVVGNVHAACTETVVAPKGCRSGAGATRPDASGLVIHGTCRRPTRQPPSNALASLRLCQFSAQTVRPLCGLCGSTRTVLCFGGMLNQDMLYFGGMLNLFQF